MDKSKSIFKNYGTRFLRQNKKVSYHQSLILFCRETKMIFFWYTKVEEKHRLLTKKRSPLKNCLRKISNHYCSRFRHRAWLNKSKHSQYNKSCFRSHLSMWCQIHLRKIYLHLNFERQNLIVHIKKYLRSQKNHPSKFKLNNICIQYTVWENNL